MKRSISSSVLRKKPKTDDDQVQSEPFPATSNAGTELDAVDRTIGLKPRMGGSGGAWKAGALGQTQEDLNERRTKIASDILHGRHEVELVADQIKDDIGSDRRNDWMDQAAFKSLFDSIEKNGQDTPIQVWPADPNWKPDPLDPENISGVPFFLITGRRRSAIAAKLGRPLRAILAAPDKRGQLDEQFEMLFMRFRENEERENLGAFERLLSIGEMFEQFQAVAQETKVTAVSFADRIGVHESLVSRGKAIYKARDEILHTCKNVYELTFRQLEQEVSKLSEAPSKKSIKPSKPKKILVTRKMGSRNLSVSSQGGKLSVSATGLDLDKHTLEELSEMIAAFLEGKGSEPASK